jgi:cyanate permease
LLGTAIETFGWRTVAFALALITWILAAPIAFLVKDNPEQYGLHPDDNDPPNPTIMSPQDQSDTEPTNSNLSEEVNLSVGQALRTSSFWAISLTHGFSATAAMTVTVHLAPALTDDNMSLPMVGFVVMTFGVTGALFQLIGGFLGDRFSKPRLISIFVILQSTGILVLATLHTPSMAFLFAVLYGAGLGGRIPLLTAIRGDYFGRANFATILGVSQVPMNLVMMGAPVAAGYLFDTLGSYTIPFLGLALLNYVGAIFILGARKPASPTPKRTQSP